jgi:hypothetical protein
MADETPFAAEADATTVDAWEPPAEREDFSSSIVETGAASNAANTELPGTTWEEPFSTPASDKSEDNERAEQETRRWQPPEPTVDRSKVRPKAGWWQRRG